MGTRGRPVIPSGGQATREVLDATAIRAQHSRLILNLLWEHREISRAELARRTSLSRSTVSAIVNDLLTTGLVREERAGASSGGRRPILLGFQDEASFIVGIELGATHISCVLTDLRCRVRASWVAPVPVRDEPELALSQMSRGVRSVLESYGVPPSRLVGFGVAVPSPVEVDRPGELQPLVMPKWKDYNIATHLEAQFSRPVFVDNDANLGALAELWWGAGSTTGSDLAYIKVATGIGAGLIINGRIFRGTTGTAGEFGHMSIDPNGPQCICGLRGCLTTFIGTPALLERARADARCESASRAPKSIEALVDAALAGDPTSKEIIEFAGEKLGVGLANLLNLLNPQSVILGGGIARAGNLLLGPVNRAIQSLSLPSAVSTTEIRTTELNEWAIAVGGATLALQCALDTPSLFATEAQSG